MRLLQHGVFEKDSRYFYVTKLFWIGDQPSRAEFSEIDKGAFDKGIIRKKNDLFERSWSVINELIEAGSAQIVMGGGLTYKEGFIR